MVIVAGGSVYKEWNSQETCKKISQMLFNTFRSLVLHERAPLPCPYFLFFRVNETKKSPDIIVEDIVGQKFVHPQ